MNSPAVRRADAATADQVHEASSRRRRPLAHPHDRLLAGLGLAGTLSDGEVQALADLPFRIHAARPHQDVGVTQERTDYCSLILEGALCRYKMISGGRRQILSFHFPGEVPDLQTLHFGIRDFSMSTVMPTQIARIPHAALHEAINSAPSLGALLWRLTAQDAAIMREAVASMGRRPAYQRVAHFICELYVRLRALGLTTGHSVPLPLRQTDMADALGLSAVHINRTLQQLRRDKLILSHGKHLAFENWQALQKAAHFDPTYLFLRAEQSAEMSRPA